MNEKTSTMTVMNDSHQPKHRADAATRVTFDRADRAFVQAVARRLVGANSADVEDVTQEALLRAYRHRDSFRGDARYHTWLYRIASSAAIAHLRKRRRSRIEALDAEATQRAIDEFADPGPPADAAVADAQVRDQIARALVDLAPSYREILMARLEGSAAEVADQLGLSVTNVKVRAHRARAQLKQRLAPLVLQAA